MKVHKIEISFKSVGGGWMIVDADSGTWTVGEGFNVVLNSAGTLNLTKTKVEFGHTFTPPEGAELFATVLLETESDVLTGRGSTSGHFSLSAEGGRVEIDADSGDNREAEIPFSLRLIKASSNSGKASPM